MHIFRRTPYICPSCTHKLSINAANRLRLRNTSKVTQQAFRSYSNASISPKPFRLAIIGSGPAGFYSAYRVMQKLQNATVDMYEHLPVPYGLVRFGVAPDHPEVKNCQDKFEEVASSPRFNFIGNVNIGHDIPLASLMPHYDAILFAYGASKDKKLGIPGEDLQGVYSARAFVGWYNGLPEYAHVAPQLDAGEQAVVIGQGNVALDVARILLSGVDALRKTDITEQALETLSRSRVKSVKVVGRRGPMQAAFTIKEVRELMNLPSVSFWPIDSSLFPPDITKLPRVQKRIAQVLVKGSSSPPSSSAKSWELSFLMSPRSFNACPSDTNNLSSMDFEETQFASDFDHFDRSAKVNSTGSTLTVPASLAFRSVGYKSEALPGLEALGVPFDDSMGIIPNDAYGRVINPQIGPGALTAGHVPGMYCAGWVKRGPTGVIASTMDDAFTSADVISLDWEQQASFLNSEAGGSSGLGWEGLKREIGNKGLRPVSWKDWKRIDKVEKEKGAKLGKEREKFTSVEDMLRVLDS
ncbi:NADPH:adrenodoxin oxidoreductase mitochondrial precursor [Lophium mytilinum]|uniref:NADPH:adrenodoxin oxidoreductase, mitochondrial n=1 Tax=Lophium mytilinum TaxID=390894 RepID=A0A6A6RFK9_9PEZI|nr:NADPH:adrenodoxin oxidoreductase mitochondrial precursor [Lophium mytilinum]